MDQALDLLNPARLPEIQEKLTRKEIWMKREHYARDFLKSKWLEDLIDREIPRSRLAGNLTEPKLKDIDQETVITNTESST